MLASESILTVVNAHFGTHGKKFTYISRNWYTLIDKFKWVKFYSTEGLHTELLVRKNSKCQHYYIPVSGELCHSPPGYSRVQRGLDLMMRHANHDQKKDLVGK